MAFDAGMVCAITEELNRYTQGARIEKIYQPEKDEILFLLHVGGKTVRLNICASANNPCIHLSTEVKENPSVPPTFCLSLRRHLSGGRFLSMEQIGFERVIRIRLEAKDEMGFPVSRFLYLEIMGKYSNLILTDGNNKILAAVRPVDFSTSQKRQILPGMLYELPPSQGKTNPLEETKEGFFQKLEGTDSTCRTDKFITTYYMGISSLVAREIAARSGASIDCGKNLLWTAFSELMERIRKKEFVPILLLNETDMPVEYCFFPVLQYGNALRSVQMPDFSLLIEKYFSSRDHSDRIRQRASDLFKLIHNTRSKLEKKIVLQEAELSEAGQKEEYKTYGDLITYNMYLVKRGMTSADLIDYNTEDLHSVSVPLDARLSPAANAQRYYKKYSKAKKAEVELTHQLSLSRSEIAYLDSVADNLLRANGQTELDEIRSELAEAGYGAKLKRNGGGAKKTVSKPLSFRTSGGYRVLCGKNNLQNEQLTLKTASKNDWWFHVKDAPGSHVILFTEGKEPSEQDFTEAASIAAVYSSLSQAKNIPVDYTQVRNIKKPTGSRPGFVVYPTHYSAYVSPSPDAVREMLEK